MFEVLNEDGAQSETMKLNINNRDVNVRRVTSSLHLYDLVNFSFETALIDFCV